MSFRDTLLAWLADGSHWLILVPACRAVVVDFLLDTVAALDRPGTTEVRGLQLATVDADGRETATQPLVLVAIPTAVLSREELHRALTQACGGGPPPEALRPHGFVVPLAEADLWAVGEAIKVFDAWLYGEPGRGDDDDEMDVDDLTCKTPLAVRGSGVAAQRMTSVAWKRSVGGMVRPSAWAVFRLMISSKVVGRCTGRSAGLAPWRMRSRYETTPRQSSARSHP
jgi:hypothetical protein